MLSGEGNAGEWRKTTVGLISKKSNFARGAHFFVHFFSVVLHEYNEKFPETSYTFYGGNVVRVLVYIFSLPLIFTFHWWPLAFPILSTPLQNFHVVLPTKKCLLCFYLSLYASVALFLVDLRWPAGYFLFFSVFLLLYIPNLWT